MDILGREDTYWVNRTLCGVLEDMRACDKVKNYAGLGGLIEEAQILGNRMESGLDDKRDLVKMNIEWSELRKKIKEARVELKEIVGASNG